MAARIHEKRAATREGRVYIHAPRRLGLLKPRPLCDQAGRGKADDHWSARYGRRPCGQVNPWLRPHGEWRECQSSIRDVEGHPLRAPNGAGALGVSRKICLVDRWAERRERKPRPTQEAEGRPSAPNSVFGKGVLVT